MRMQRIERTKRLGTRPQRAVFGAAALLSALLAFPAAGKAQSRPSTPPRAAAPREAVFRVPGGGWLGVGVETRLTGAPGSPAERVVITRVEPGSPAARAGLRRGDTVLELNGEPAVATAFHALPFTLNAGDTVTLLVRRANRDQRIVVVAGERPGRYALGWVISADTLKRLTIELMDSARAALGAMYRLQLTADSLWNAQRELAAAAAELGRAQAVLRDSMARLHLSIADADGRVRMAWALQADSILAPWALDAADTARTAAVRRLRRAMVRAPDLQFIHMLGERGVAGAEFVELNPGLAQYFTGATEGVLTVRVAPATPAARAQLEPGDVIVSVQGRPVRSVGELRAALLDTGGLNARPVRLEVVRKGERRELVLQADQRL